MRIALLIICLWMIGFTSAAQAQTPAQEDFLGLLVELLDYRDNPEFQQVGFGVCCEYRKWLERVEALDDRTPELFPFDGGFFVIGDLSQLGLDFAKSGGRQTDYTRFMAEEICPILEGKTTNLTSPQSDNLQRFCSGR